MTEFEPGMVVEGEVTTVTKFGAFVKLEGGEEGLVHISEIANEFITDINTFVQPGQKLQVKVLNRNSKGKLDLSVRRVGLASEEHPTQFLKTRSKDEDFETKMSGFMKRSEEKQIDIRRNLKVKQGVRKRK